MAADPLLQAVRAHLALGRLVPLGATSDRAWLAERAAGSMMRRAVARARLDVRLDDVRLSLATAVRAGEGAGGAPADAPRRTAEPGEPLAPPPSALPPGPLRMAAACAVRVDRPLGETVRELRATLAVAARERVGLDVTEVDVHVAELLEDAAGASGTAGGEDGDTGGRGEGGGDGGRASGVVGPVAEAVLAVPGVVRLSGTLAGWARSPVGVVRLQLVVAPDRPTLAVVRQARAAAAAASRPAATVAVAALVTDVSGHGSSR